MNVVLVFESYGVEYGNGRYAVMRWFTNCILVDIGQLHLVTAVVCWSVAHA